MDGTLRKNVRVGAGTLRWEAGKREGVRQQLQPWKASHFSYWRRRSTSLRSRGCLSMQFIVLGLLRLLIDQTGKNRLIQVIKGWDEGILGGDGVPPMLAGMNPTYYSDQTVVGNSREMVTM